MKITFDQEETQEIQHPTLPLRVTVLVPERMEQIKIGMEMGKRITRVLTDPADPKKPLFVNGKVQTLEVFEQAPVSKMIDLLSNIIKKVEGDGLEVESKGRTYEPKPSEWARKFMNRQFDFKRLDPVLLRSEDGADVFRDPDTNVDVPEENRKLWKDPLTGLKGMYLWDSERNEPVRREEVHTFWEELLNRSVRQADAEEAEKKDLPAPSIV